MDENNKDLGVSNEERTAEEETIKEVPEEDLRTQLAEEFGFDPDEDAERLDKLVQKELKHRKTISTAVKQKIKIRTELEKLTSKKTDTSSGQSQSSNNDAPDYEAILDKKLQAALQERDLKTLNLPQELEEEVRDIATRKGISVMEAANSPYIKYQREQIEADQRIQNATPSGKGGSGLPKGFDPSKPLDSSKFDLSTEEGRKQWEAAKQVKRKQS